MSELILSSNVAPDRSLSLREQSAIDVAFQQGFCDKYQLHLGGTLCTAVALVWILNDFGSLPKLSIWFGVVVFAVGFMASSYRCAVGPPSGYADFDRRAMATLTGAVAVGAVAWLDMDALADSAYAFAMCACLVAYAGGTLANLSPMSFLVKLTVFPALLQVGMAMLIVGQIKPAICVMVFLSIVGFRSLDLGRQQLEGLIRQREREAWRAEHDPMTGLLNRSGIESRIGADQTLLFIDVDDFKRINDVHGHLVGDRVLFGIGRRVRSIVEPKGGSVARVGGDEFLVVLTGLERVSVDRVVAEIIESLSDTDDLGAAVTVSIGIAESKGCVEAALARADAALYDAKASEHRWASWAD